MLPAIRMQANPYEIPKFDIKVPDIKSFAKELKGFHSQFTQCFSREEPRENFYQYMSGQFSAIERKSIEPIAVSIENGHVRSMQRFVSDVHWDENMMSHPVGFLCNRQAYVHLVSSSNKGID